MDKIIDTIIANLRNRRFYVFLLVLFIVILLLFPYIDANVFYYQRVNNRIDILVKISEFDTQQISDNPILLDEYANVLSEIEKQSDGSLGSMFIRETDPTVNLIKFIVGGILFWIVAFACFFIKNFKNFSQRIAGFIIFLVLGGIFGFISKAIPTIRTPVVNYVAFPLLLIIIAALLATSGNKQKRQEQ